MSFEERKELVVGITWADLLSLAHDDSNYCINPKSFCCEYRAVRGLVEITDVVQNASEVEFGSKFLRIILPVPDARSRHVEL